MFDPAAPQPFRLTESSDLIGVPCPRCGRIFQVDDEVIETSAGAVVPLGAVTAVHVVHAQCAE